MRKALIITTISGFVPQFEMNNVSLLQEMGYEVHYASNFNRPVYDFDKELFQQWGIITHPLFIEKSPVHVINSNFAYRFYLCTLKIQYLAGIRLSKFYPLPYAA